MSAIDRVPIYEHIWAAAELANWTEGELIDQLVEAIENTRAWGAVRLLEERARAKAVAND